MNLPAASRLLNRPCWIIGVVALALALGCGQGVSRYTVSGNVTYQGEPVPHGEISFDPDLSQGAAGPGCIATIKHGIYQTPPGKGTAGGKHRVRIIHVPEENETLGTVEPLLFRPYETTVELPAAASHHDFDVQP